MPDAYAIRNWDELFENSRSRAVEKCRYVCVPNRHDGECYSYIMAHPQGAEIYAAWVLMLQVASKSPVRGLLLRGNGAPHTPGTLSVVTRAPESWFQTAIDFLLTETDWLELQRVTQSTSGERQSSDVRNVSQVYIERNGKKGTEWKEESESARAIPRSVSEVMEQAALMALPAVEAQKFWDHYEGNGWMAGPNPVRDWRAKLRKWKTEWESRRETANGKGGASLSPVDRIALTRRTEEIRNRLREISDEWDYETSDRQKLREERAGLQNEQKAIKAKLDKANKALLNT